MTSFYGVILLLVYTCYMKISIIDIGTQSIKHYIFSINGIEKEAVHYKRYSDAHLGNDDEINEEAMRRNLAILQECLARNGREGVEELKLLGTDILRKAKSANNFLEQVRELSGQDVEVISQDLEANYLYLGFVPIVPDRFHFAAFNIGGGSTEVVMGDARRSEGFITLPFGVKLLRSRFADGEKVDWARLDEYLEREVKMEKQVDNVFITGALDCISVVGPALGVTFDTTAIPNHPLSLSIDEYREYILALRKTPVSELKALYLKDPDFCDNLALGQSVYFMIAKKLSSKTIIPSRNDLTDGVIYEMLHHKNP